MTREHRSRALIAAAEWGDVEGVRELVAAGVDPAAAREGGESALCVAARAGEPEVVELLAPHFSRGEVRRARRLAKRTAADVTSPGRVRRFLEAAATGRRAALERMLAAGMSPDAADEESGETALWLAVASGYLGAVQRLLQAGADHERRVHWETPIFRALEHAADSRTQRELIRVLARGGADLEARDADGLTPLMRAVMDGPGNPEAVRALAACGADLDAKHEAGVSALELARQQPAKAQLARLLEELGARDAAAAPTASRRGLARADEAAVVLLVRADVEEVAASLHAQRAACDLREDLLRAGALAPGDEGFLVYQFREHAWTLAQSPILDRRSLHRDDAEALSRSFSAPALLCELSLAAGLARWELYEEGRLIEQRSGAPEALDARLRELDAFVPGVGDDDLARLGREFAPSDFARVDWVGLAAALD